MHMWTTHQFRHKGRRNRIYDRQVSAASPVVMSVRSSSSSNSSLPASSSVSLFRNLFCCYISKVGAVNITALTAARVSVILPLCILVLHLGHRRWRQQRSGMTISHADLVTYHMVVTELLNVFGSALICCGVHSDLYKMIEVGILLSAMNLIAQMFFHALTCVERYLAVVHPVTYLSLRKAKGIRIRNVAIGCVWLLCVASGLMSKLGEVLNTVIYFCLLAFVLTVVSFCSLSVLRALIRPGPGEGGGGRDRQQVDQSKLRAFHTIMAILGVLLFRFGMNLIAFSLYASLQVVHIDRCGMLLSTLWFSLPSSLVLPLLFLQRAGKLLCCKNNNEPGQGSD